VKRCLGFLVLGFVGLMLASATAVQPVTIAGHATQSLAPTNPQPSAAAKETDEGRDLSACPPGAGHSRIAQSSLNGIILQRVVFATLESHALGTEAFFECFAHELGFSQFLRAPLHQSL
jgi:hypothetical protein